MNMSMGGGSMMPGSVANKADQFPLDLDVEIYGIIYIYNPPIAEKLGVEKVNEDTVIDGTAMKDGRKVEEPAAAVPAGAAPETVSTPEALPAPSATDAVAPVDGNPSLPVAPLPVDPVPLDPVPVDPVPVDPVPVDAAAGPAPASGVHLDRKNFAFQDPIGVA